MIVETVHKNGHYSDLTRIVEHDQKLSWTVKVHLGEDCLYNFNNKKYNQQSNKIEGKGYGLNHHLDSVRTAFRPVFDSTGLIPKNKFGILAYYYNHGKMSSKSLFQVLPDEEFEYTVTCDRVNNTVTWSSPKLKVPKSYFFDWANVPIWGLKLFFYFGGDKTAPNDMNLIFNEQ